MHGPGGPGQREATGKDTSMFELSPTDCAVRVMRFQDEVAKAERYHALVRGDKIVGRAPVALPAIRLPHISLISRLFHVRLRPA